MAAAVLDQAAGIETIHVPYRGGGQLITDLISGKIDFGFATAATTLPHVQTGRLRALAVPTAHRSGLAPDVPTIAESGYPDFDAVSWTGMMAPAGTPKEIVDRLGAEIARAVKDPKFVEQIVKAGNDPLGYGPAEFVKMIASEIPAWGDAVRSAGVKLN